MVEQAKAIIRQFPGFYGMLRAAWHFQRRARQHAFQWRIALRRLQRRTPNHGLPAPLVVSLTSYPARFHTLHLTLITLLSQDIVPDHLVLWVARGDEAALPRSVLRLKPYGLQIRPCDDLKSYTKIIPALQVFPDAFIVTADDDICYWQGWLRALVASYRDAPAGVICHRAHRIRLDPAGLPQAYLRWQLQLNAPQPIESPLVFPTGVGGVLYAPQALHPGTCDVQTFMTLCPTADDVWLYWMARLQGSRVRKIGPDPVLTQWDGSQAKALYRVNTTTGGGNDQAIGRMVGRFGFSWTDDPS